MSEPKSPIEKFKKFSTQDKVNSPVFMEADKPFTPTPVQKPVTKPAKTTDENSAAEEGSDKLFAFRINKSDLDAIKSLSFYQKRSMKSLFAEAVQMLLLKYGNAGRGE